MKSKNVLILLSAVLLVFAAFMYSQRQAETAGSADKLIPELSENVNVNINRVIKIEVLRKSSETLFTLSREDGGWQVDERDGYEVDVGLLRETLFKLADATLTEEKTSNVAHYEKLGVEEVSNEQAQGFLLKLTMENQRITPIIFGNMTTGSGQNQYVRRMGERTSWQIDQQIDWNKTPAYWLRKDLLSVPIKQISKVEISSQGKTSIEIINEDPEQSIISLKESASESQGGQLDQSKVYEVADALAKFELIDVVSEAFIGDAVSDSVELKYTSLTGQVIDLRLATKDQRYFAQIDAAFSPESFDAALLEKLGVAINEDEVRDSIQSLLARSEGRWFEISQLQYESMAKSRSDFYSTEN